MAVLFKPNSEEYDGGKNMKFHRTLCNILCTIKIMRENYP